MQKLSSALVLELVVEIKGELLNSRRRGTNPPLLYIQMTTKSGRPLPNKILILINAYFKSCIKQTVFFSEKPSKKKKKKSLMLKNETEGKEHQRSKS